MSKKKKGAKDSPVGGAEAPGRPDLSLITSLSLLAGGLASYPQLQGMIEGKVDLIPAVTWFLAATLIAMVGLGVVASLFRSFSAAHDAARAEEARVEAEEQADLVADREQREGIAQTLADTDAMVDAERAVIS